MRDAYLLALVFASNVEAVNSLAAEIASFDFIGCGNFRGKNTKFYSYVVCFVLPGIFLLFFDDILEVVDRKIVIICI